MFRRGYWLATVLFVAVGLFGGGAAVAAPGLWVAKSDNSTVYLFGTIHILQQGGDWQSPEIAKAFAASSELWLEIPNADDRASATGLIREYGFDRQHPLSTKLSPQDRAKLDAAVKIAQLPRGEAALERHGTPVEAVTRTARPQQTVH